MTKVLSALALLLLANVPARAEWSLLTCPPEFATKAEQLATLLRAAKPGAPGYVPFPFAREEAGIIGNFRAQYLDLWRKHSTSDVPEPDRKLLELLKADGVRYEILRVANWLPARCGASRGEIGVKLALRLYHRARGDEIARVTLAESGELEEWSIPRENALGLGLASGHDIQPIARVVAEVERRGFLQATDFQYVALRGVRHIACYEQVPCIAFRKGARTFLYHLGTVYELQYPAKQISLGRFTRGTDSDREALLALLRPQDDWVSLGGDGLTGATALPNP